MNRCKALLFSAVIALSACAPKSDTITITNPIEMNSDPAIMTVYEWIGDEIADFQEITFKESIRLFSEQGSGILYFGYDDCPWCERAVPLLNEAALETGITVYYVDVYGPFQPTKDEFDELLGYIEETLIEDDKGEKAFFVPAVIGVKKGRITGSHVSLLSDFTLEDENSQLSEEQKKKLKDIYMDIIYKTAD